MKEIAKKLLHADVPVGVLRPCLRGAHRVGVVLAELVRLIYGQVVVSPVVRSLAEGGKRLRIEQMPYIRGQGRLVLGGGIYISGLLGVSFLAREGNHGTHGRHGKGREGLPLLKIGDRTFVGHGCSFALSKGIEIGDDCLIAAGTKIQDNDGHPLDPEARLAKERVPVDDIQPVKIGNNVWIASRCTILKGVTIGDNAVVGTGSIVTKDVPANTVVAGNPARIIRRLGTTERTESTEKRKG